MKKDNNTKMCPTCHTIFSGRGDYCSPKCKTDYYWRDVKVKQCRCCHKDLDFRLFGAKADYEKALFCDRKCFTEYLRKIYDAQETNLGWYRINVTDVNIKKYEKGWYWKVYKDGNIFEESNMFFHSLTGALNNAIERFG